MNRVEFERVYPSAVGISAAAIESFLDELESGFTEPHGLMILRHGKVCAEGWWSPYAPGIRHGLQSLSKTYAATAVGIACTEGILRLDERVVDLFPEHAPAAPSELLQKLTVKDVLCMGTGMETMPRPGENWIADFLATPVLHEPGSAFFYNSTGSTLLAAMVRARSGETLQEYLKKRLFDKIGIDAENLLWTTMPDGTEVGGGGLFATTEDNLRLMKLYLDGGVHHGERILSSEYVSLATSKRIDTASEAIGNPPALDNFVGYGFQIWMCRHPGCYRADGAFGQYSIVHPKLDLIVSINETAGSMMNGSPFPPEIERISLRFEPMACRLGLRLKDGAEAAYRIPLDGSRCENAYADAFAPMTKVLLSGSFEQPDCLVVRARWIETCFEQEYCFRLERNGLSVLRRGVNASFAFLAGLVPGECFAERIGG